MNLEERELNIVRLMADGNRDYERELYDAYAGYLTGVCARYLSDEDDLKDVVQDSLISVFSALGSFRYSGSGSLRAWITRIAVNRALQYLRDKRRFSYVDISDYKDDFPESDPEIGDLSEKEILILIRKLPPGYRTVFNLHAFEGKSHKEIARMMNIKENSSASQYHRAKSMLAAMIRSYVKQKQGNGHGR